MIADTTMVRHASAGRLAGAVKFHTCSESDATNATKAPDTDPAKPAKPLEIGFERLTGMAGGKLAATSYTGPMLENIVGLAVLTPTESGGFSRPKHSVCGREGPLRERGRMASPMFSTSRPPFALENAAGGFQSRLGAIAMTTVNTPATSTMDTPAVQFKAAKRTKPVVITITKPDGLSFRTRHTDARGNAVLNNLFDVPAEDYGNGWDTGRRAAAELLAVIKAHPRTGTPMLGLRLGDLLPDVANALADHAPYDSPARKGAALGFLSVLDEAIQFAAHNADMQGYVQRELDCSEAWRLREVERKAAERVEFVARMQAARRAKRAALGAMA